MNQKEYVFDDVNKLVDYLFAKFGELSPLKLQKGLYFLFAYYGATYGQEEKEGVLEETFNLPPKLFDAEFEAWTYGPVIREVYYKYNNNEYDSDKVSIEKAEEIFDGYDKVKEFVDEIFDQINSISDFSLVDRSHEDNCWKEAYKDGKSTPINHEDIIKEYTERYVG